MTGDNDSLRILLQENEAIFDSIKDVDVRTSEILSEILQVLLKMNKCFDLKEQLISVIRPALLNMEEKIVLADSYKTLLTEMFGLLHESRIRALSELDKLTQESNLQQEMQSREGVDEDNSLMLSEAREKILSFIVSLTQREQKLVECRNIYHENQNQQTQLILSIQELLTTLKIHTRVDTSISGRMI
ncbi:hypothetical protein QAD02_014957 [Eretmocerus hayati]|uniref:Uncharacterized protein n=1 Tax=Eretmocerus hayati TaxID=131215 RepID=A0ACC2PBP4_9HYME|nr:hypothetical protein QAD02_014957 [Eretmocerus hayati]